MTTLKNAYYKERAKRFKSKDVLNADDLYLDNKEIKNAASILRSVDHPLRLKILQWLHEVQESNVQKICLISNTVQPTVSLHLGILQNAKMVSTKKKGHQIIYSINYSTLERLNNLVNDFLPE